VVGRGYAGGDETRDPQTEFSGRIRTWHDRRKHHEEAEIVRLLGDREAVDALTDTLDHIVIDRGEQVASDAEAIKLLARRVPVVAFVNNHFAGYAPETVRQLVALTDRDASA
jgi:hypothetical protein